MVSSTLMSSSIVVVEFGWKITSVFFILILRPNFDDALANASTILWISSAEWAICVMSSAKSGSFTSIIVVFVFALKCETVKRSAFWRDWMLTPFPMSLKVSSSIDDIKIENIVGASRHPCLTPFVITNVYETCPPFLTLTIIPVCRIYIMVGNFSGHPYFLSSCHSPGLPTMSNAFVKSIKTIYRGRSFSMHVSWSCCRQRIMSTVLRMNKNRTASLAPPLG